MLWKKATCRGTGRAAGRCALGPGCPADHSATRGEGNPQNDHRRSGGIGLWGGIAGRSGTRGGTGRLANNKATISHRWAKKRREKNDDATESSCSVQTQ
jgi:hypothetical protein